MAARKNFSQKSAQPTQLINYKQSILICIMYRYTVTFSDVITAATSSNVNVFF